MPYKVSIEEMRSLPEKSYPETEKVYEQVVVELNIAEVIKAVNQFNND